jgi:hypothetical protein
LDDARKQEEEEEERSSIKVQYEISNIVSQCWELKRNKDSQRKFGYFNESYE